MTFHYEHRARTDHMLSQTTKKNMKKLLALSRHVEQLCDEVLIPLSTIDEDMELPSEFENDIKTFQTYAEFQHVSPILVTCQPSELDELISNLECPSPQGWFRRVIGADDDRDDLTMLSEGIKNAVDGLTVSHHCMGSSNFMLITPICFRRGKQCALGLI